MKYFVLTSKVRIAEMLLGPKFFRCLIFEVRFGPLQREWLRGYSSAGRAPALQAGGHRFDPDYLHHGIRDENQERLTSSTDLRTRGKKKKKKAT